MFKPIFGDFVSAPKPLAKREPRPMNIEIIIKVRNVRSGDYDSAKNLAKTQLKINNVDFTDMACFATKELDGSFTVEFR